MLTSANHFTTKISQYKVFGDFRLAYKINNPIQKNNHRLIRSLIQLPTGYDTYNMLSGSFIVIYW